MVKPNGRLVRVSSNALLRFHPPPIKVVVFDCPSYPAEAGLGDLILGRASCLDAFSIYLFQTSLPRSEEHTSELQSLAYLVCRLLLEKKKKKRYHLLCN